MTRPLRLTSAHVVLRDFTSADVDDAYAVLGDDRVTHWLSFDSKTRDDTADMLTNIIKRAEQTPRTEYYLAITVANDTRAVGFARLGLNGVRAAKLGYAVHADHWSHGHATAATHTLTEYGFRELGLHRISAAIGPDNRASLAVARSLGMSLEGRIRDHVHTNGAWRDSLLMAVLAHDWNAAHSGENSRDGSTE